MSGGNPLRDTGQLQAELVETLRALERGRQAKAAPPAEAARLLEQAETRLREASIALASERARYRALLDAVPDPVSILTWEGVVLDLNHAGEAAYQRPREDIVGKPIELLNPDLPAGHMLPVHEALLRGDSYVIEVNNMRADGSRFPVEVHSACYLQDGQRRIVAVARDLSARQDAEMRYRSLVEHIEQAVTIQRTDGQVTYMNKAAMRSFEFDGAADAIPSPNWSDWLVIDEHGHELAFQDYPMMRALREARSLTNCVIGLYRRTSKRLQWLSVTSVPLFGPGADTPHSVLSLSSDITWLKRDSALFERVQELALIGGWQWDRASDALYMTPEAVRILGLAHAPASFREFMDSLEPASCTTLRATVDAIDRQSGFDLELQGTDPEGWRFWIRMAGEPDLHDPGRQRLSGTLQDITERKRSEHALRVQATTDPLTGLVNRDEILERLQALMHAGKGMAVLYIDLDRFKLVNDVQGHAAGDALLVNAARRIQEAVAGEGEVARFGGDEFLVVCPVDDDPQRPERLARAVLHAFSDSFRMGGDEFTITASIGIARAPQDGVRPQQLIQNADVAMYDSKRRARNSWQLFSAELAQKQQARLLMETHLRRALDNREFHLVFQPQAELRSGRVVAAEALVRWRNAQLGEMRPDAFIDMAETTGDIIRIGNWVLRESCLQMRRWRDAGLPIQRMAVNVSYRQFTGDNLAERVREILDATGLEGSALELEFTERVLIEDAPDTLQTFDTLREMGVLLSIDDFGEGYSALNYLRRLPIHGLKLSQLFVRGVPGNESDVAICQAVVAIARSLGLDVVAEGVETDAQRDFLLRLGVHLGQGFLFAPGLLPGEFARRLNVRQVR